MTINRTLGAAALVRGGALRRGCGGGRQGGHAAEGRHQVGGWGIPGVTKAPVEGDMAKGASHFYLKYAAGLVTPVHHHSPTTTSPWCRATSC